MSTFSLASYIKRIVGIVLSWNCTCNKTAVANFGLFWQSISSHLAGVIPTNSWVNCRVTNNINVSTCGRWLQSMIDHVRHTFSVLVSLARICPFPISVFPTASLLVSQFSPSPVRNGCCPPFAGVHWSPGLFASAPSGLSPSSLRRARPSQPPLAPLPAALLEPVAQVHVLMLYHELL